MREKSIKHCKSCIPSLLYYEKTQHWENCHISHCNHGNVTNCSLIIRYYFLTSMRWRTASSACVYFIINILISTSLQDIKHPQSASDHWKLESLTSSTILKALCDPFEPSSNNNVRAVHSYLYIYKNIYYLYIIIYLYTISFIYLYKYLCFYYI